LARAFKQAVNCPDDSGGMQTNTGRLFLALPTIHDLFLRPPLKFEIRGFSLI
jgi:hypothetical protein